MKITLLSLILFSSLMTLTGCLKGCDKDKKHSEQPTEPSMEKKEESKAEKGSDKESVEKTALETNDGLKEMILENKDALKDRARNLYKSASMGRPDEIWLEGKDEELGYGEPRFSDASRYRYGERTSRFI